MTIVHIKTATVSCLSCARLEKLYALRTASFLLKLSLRVMNYERPCHKFHCSDTEVELQCRGQSLYL